MMNVNLLQILLFVVVLFAGVTHATAYAACELEELCEAQALVDEIVEEITDQQEIIELQWRELDSAADRHTLIQWFEQSKCLVTVVNHYLSIGTLESRLLVAYKKLNSARVMVQSENPRCYCNERIQLSASY